MNNSWIEIYITDKNNYRIYSFAFEKRVLKALFHVAYESIGIQFGAGLYPDSPYSKRLPPYVQTDRDILK